MGISTILLVEDEEYIRESLKEILEMNGYKVTTAENGKPASRPRQRPASTYS